MAAKGLTSVPFSRSLPRLLIHKARDVYLMYGVAQGREMAMEAYAVVETGGKQYRVEKDNVISVERLDAEVGSEVELSTVLAVSDGENLTVGAPVIEGAVVKATILEQYRGDKVVAFKKKKRKGYKRKVGHRQELTKLQVAEISVG